MAPKRTALGRDKLSDQDRRKARACKRIPRFCLAAGGNECRHPESAIESAQHLPFVKIANRSEPGKNRLRSEGVEIERDFDRALQQAQVAMMLRIQRERLAGLELDLGEYIARYQLSAERLAASAPKALVMHPGPMIRGHEISGDVADGPQSAIEDQVRHGLAVRSALLVRALSAAGFESVTV